ncbi:MAG: biotin--[acetyl-CoA-carboxylase] ligase [Pseudobutyrivibrio sp.]|nr:biotin--[acetyl-CoA-carboxylase] ligase [Pseudobutyrivibrio sp.]
MIPSKYLVLNQILKASNNNLYISGQEIAQSLGLSRSAVNKAVSAIRSEGYDIDAINRKGYLITSDPNLINPGELLGILPAKRLESVAILDTVNSTNVKLHELAEEGALSGQIVIASCQTAGRGRAGSNFDSPDNKSIYASYLIRPDFTLDPKTITPKVAQIVAKSINEYLNTSAISYTDAGDLFLDDKKICGILTEMLSEAGSGYVRYIMIGIGIRPINSIKRASLIASIIQSLDKTFLLESE